MGLSEIAVLGVLLLLAGGTSKLTNKSAKKKAESKTANSKEKESKENSTAKDSQTKDYQDTQVTHRSS